MRDLTAATDAAAHAYMRQLGVDWNALDPASQCAALTLVRPLVEAIADTLAPEPAPPPPPAFVEIAHITVAKRLKDDGEVTSLSWTRDVSPYLLLELLGTAQVIVGRRLKEETPT